jgi:hypothetical protein
LSTNSVTSLSVVFSSCEASKATVLLDCSKGFEDFGTAFAKPGGSISKDIGDLWPPVPNDLEDYQVVIGVSSNQNHSTGFPYFLPTGFHGECLDPHEIFGRTAELNFEVVNRMWSLVVKNRLNFQ